MSNLQTIQSNLVLVKKEISAVRERKGGEEDALKLINRALELAHDFVVSLILEKHIVFQHEVMKENALTIEEQNKEKMKKYTKLMEGAAREAEEYAKRNKLRRWSSRVDARLGRAMDYKKDYKMAIFYYKRAIKSSDLDPEQKEEGIPRWLEYKGFLAFSTMMKGNVSRGLSIAKEAYEEYGKGIGLELKKKDYPTWAIWKSGVPIRMIGGLIESGDDFDRKKMLAWLSDAEKILKVPKSSNRWIGKIDFGFRKDEITSVRRKLAS